MKTILNWMRLSGVTQAQLGKALGKTQPTVSSILSGDTDLKASDAKIIMSMSGLTWSDIYGDVPARLNQPPSTKRTTKRVLRKPTNHTNVTTSQQKPMVNRENNA